MELVPAPLGQIEMFDVSPCVPSFDAWWAEYPRKTCKADALKAFLRVPPAERHWLIESTPLWRESWLLEGREMRHIPYPATFVNRGDWREPPPEVEPLEPAGFRGIRNLLASERYL